MFVVLTYNNSAGVASTVELQVWNTWHCTNIHFMVILNVGKFYHHACLYNVTNLKCLHYSYKCASWYSQSCKDCSEWLTPNCDGSNVTGIHSIRQGHHDVFIGEPSSLKWTSIGTWSPKCTTVVTFIILLRNDSYCPTEGGRGMMSPPPFRFIATPGR
jgi:hypothetical protein